MKARPNLGDYLKSVARMRRPVAPCLDEQEVVAFYSGTLGQKEAEGVRNHLADCPKCLDLAAEVRQFVEAMSGTVDVAPTQTVVGAGSPTPVLPQPSAHRSLWETLRGYLRVSPVFAFSAVAAVALVALSALLLVEVFRLQNQLQNMQTSQGEKDRQLQELEQELALERTRVEQLAAELRGHSGPPSKEQSEPERATDQRQPEQTIREPLRDPTRLASFVLTPSLVRDVTQNRPFELSPTISQVELLVILSADDYKSYSVVLRTYDGEQKTSRSGIKATSTASGKRLAIVIPASVLDKRDYVLRLIGVTSKGDREELDQYPFSIVRK